MSRTYIGVPSRMSYPELKVDYTMFLDQTTILYGESKTGKSFLIRDMLYLLKPHIQQVIVISPTDAQNSSYDGIIPKPCIHYAISEQHLSDIYERQLELYSICKKANKEDSLRDLYSLIPPSRRAVCDDALRSVKSHLETLKSQGAADLEKATAECAKFRIALWKHAIGQNIKYLQSIPLSENQQISLGYMNVNPKMLIIFDDCTEQLDKIKRSSVIQSLFYKGRHADITLIIGCHTDKSIDAAVRKNTFVTIFTAEAAARAYFNRPSADFDRATKNKAFKAIDTIFSTKHQKMVCIRGDRTIYRYTATGHSDFRFGSEYLWKFCDKVKTEDGALPMNNRFSHYFR